MRIPEHIATIDVETTGLYVSSGHMPWEVSYAIGEREPVTLLLPHSTYSADPKALEMNGYYERWTPQPREAAVRQVDHMFSELQDKHLLGANVRFDMLMLHHWWGGVTAEAWHYRAVELESQAMLMLNLDAPPGLHIIVQKLNSEYDANIPEADHSALGDVETARAAYRFIRDWRNALL